MGEQEGKGSLEEMIMRFAIPVVFSAATNVQCVYWSDTAVFIGRI